MHTTPPLTRWQHAMRWLLAHEKQLMAAAAVATVALAIIATRLETQHGAAAFLDEASTTVHDFNRLGDRFGQSRTLLYTVFPSARGDSPAFLRVLAALTDSVGTYAGVDAAISLATVQVPVRQGNRLTTEPFWTDTLDAAALRARLAQHRFTSGLLVDSAGGAPLLLVKVNEAFNDTPARMGLVQQIRAAATRLAPDAVLAGFPNTRTEYGLRIRSEMPLFTALSLALSLLLLVATFHSLRAALLPLGVVGLALVWTAGLMALFGQKINIVTAVLPALIILIGMATVVHFLARYYLAVDRTNNVEVAVEEMLDTVGFAALLTSATTIVGFGVMAFTGSRMLAGFGLFAAAGVAIVYGLALVLLPFALRRMPAPRGTHRPATGPRAGAIFKRLGLLLSRHSGATLVVAALVVVAAAAGLARLSTDLYVFADFSPRDPLRREMATFEQHYGGLIPVEILIESRTPGGLRALPSAERMDRLARRVAALPGVGAARSPADLVKAANQAYLGGDPRAYRLPSRYELPFLQRALAGADAGALGGKLPRLVDTTFTTARVLAGVADVGTSRMETLVDSMKAEADRLFPSGRYRVAVTGTGVVVSAGNRTLLRNLLVSLAVALALISLLMGALFRSARLTLVSLVPNLLPLLCVGGAMGWLGITLRPSTALIFPLAFGIAVDDTIHFLAKYRMLRGEGRDVPDAVRETLRVTGRAIVLTSLVLMAGFLLFLLSDFGGTVSLGALTAAALGGALVANLFVLPALLFRYGR